ncbi:high-affinity nickel-transporter protein [Halorarum halophilum]|uniref:High-affinity nickel-transporter protein n=1 Tax=Halorarum halophilum TaxID=2743090 RepID=A0A7D5GMN6_9EURY|nr:high-affinity nickel-transporter protein [Halobaculum halophilum]QLG28704.1 high-affinity nickel-transporter protein [Halobaculum halophilum]
MSLTGALAAGAVLGARHALETDHVAAIATLVEEDDTRTGLVGASWGVGHSVPIVVLGLLFVALGIRLPERVTGVFEAIVGVILVLLGARMLWRLISGGVGVETHEHGTDGVEGDGHDRDTHSHFRFGSLSVGSGHGHVDSESFLVGVVHGFAGSGALVIALVASTPSVGAALWFLAGFSALSVVTMAAVSSVWGRALGLGATRYLEGAAGLVSVIIGGLLLVEQVGPHLL